ncbi:MAG: SANT/Myb domain-containing protein [Parachlamydiaceae bacterium]|nr:SANT/Myb domain-containing protein [Parachlamydiaceae bacterium]
MLNLRSSIPGSSTPSHPGVGAGFHSLPTWSKEDEVALYFVGRNVTKHKFDWNNCQKVFFQNKSKEECETHYSKIRYNIKLIDFFGTAKATHIESRVNDLFVSFFRIGPRKFVDAEPDNKLLKNLDWKKEANPQNTKNDNSKDAIDDLSADEGLDSESISEVDSEDIEEKSDEEITTSRFKKKKRKTNTTKEKSSSLEKDEAVSKADGTLERSKKEPRKKRIWSGQTWEENDVRKLVEAVKQNLLQCKKKIKGEFVPQWKKIAAYFPGRSDKNVREHYKFIEDNPPQFLKDKTDLTFTFNFSNEKQEGINWTKVEVQLLVKAVKENLTESTNTKVMKGTVHPKWSEIQQKHFPKYHWKPLANKYNDLKRKVQKDSSFTKKYRININDFLDLQASKSLADKGKKRKVKEEITKFSELERPSKRRKKDAALSTSSDSPSSLQGGSGSSSSSSPQIASASSSGSSSMAAPMDVRDDSIQPSAGSHSELNSTPSLEGSASSSPQIVSASSSGSSSTPAPMDVRDDSVQSSADSPSELDSPSSLEGPASSSRSNQASMEIGDDSDQQSMSSSDLSEPSFLTPLELETLFENNLSNKLSEIFDR